MDMGRLQRPSLVTDLMGAALAPATKSFYARVWNQLAEKHLPDGRLSFPMPINAVADYLATLFQRGFSPSTMFSHASAIAYGHKIRGLSDPTEDFRIRQLLNGAKKLRVATDERKALSLQDVQMFCDKLYGLGLRLSERKAFRAIFLLGFFGLLRPGELVRGGAAKHTLQLSDVTLADQRLTIRIPSSKTCQIPQRVTLEVRPDLSCCPFQAMRDFIRVRPQGGSDLFLDAAGSAISTARLTSVLKAVAQRSGMSPTGISGHCLRIGGASHGALQGMTELQLAEAGRWRSRAVRRYVRRSISVLSAT